MSVPGEVIQQVGRDYMQALIGCLEASMGAFRREYEVTYTPDKLTFETAQERSFSFDVKGVYNYPGRKRDVFIECKGYTKGSNLRTPYQHFVARAYVASSRYLQSRDDDFWFVTNVPFAIEDGKNITSYETLTKILTESTNQQTRTILEGTTINDRHVRRLAGNIAVCILTDTFMKRTGLSYPVRSGDFLWDIGRRFHDDTLSVSQTGTFVQEVMQMNTIIKNPHYIEADWRLRTPWYGFPEDEATIQ